MDSMIFDDLWWLVWLLVIFLPFELIMAMDKKPGGTLSENVWDWFAIRNKKAKFGHSRRLVLAGFMVALTFHFVYATSVLWVILTGIGMGASIAYHYAVERRKK